MSIFSDIDWKRAGGSVLEAIGGQMAYVDNAGPAADGGKEDTETETGKKTPAETQAKNDAGSTDAAAFNVATYFPLALLATVIYIIIKKM